jgi:hypothetical protein
LGVQSYLQQRLLGAFLIAMLLAYGMVFSERKDPVAFRRLLQHLGRREWSRASEVFPLWLSTLPFVILTCILLVGVSLISAPNEETRQVVAPAVAMVFFLLRDLGIILFLNLGRVPKRADMLTMLFLFLLYGAIPTILSGLELDLLPALFWPVSGMPAEILLPAALIQAVVMFWLLVRRWRKSHHLSSLQKDY